MEMENNRNDIKYEDMNVLIVYMYDAPSDNPDYRGAQGYPRVTPGCTITWVTVTCYWPGYSHDLNGLQMMLNGS